VVAQWAECYGALFDPTYDFNDYQITQVSSSSSSSPANWRAFISCPLGAQKNNITAQKQQAATENKHSGIRKKSQEIQR